MQKLMYFLFGLITALFVAVMIIEHQCPPGWSQAGSRILPTP